MENIETTENTTETSNTETSAPAKEPKARPTPAYVAFVAALETKAKSLGLNVKEQRGYFQFMNLATKHRLVVAKQGKAVTRIDTTLEVLGQEGTYPLEKPNGRIACHIDANLDTVMTYLEVLASSDAKIRAPKREKKASTEGEQAQASA